MTCIFLWFCILIYPNRRRQNLKALVRVKSVITGKHSPEKRLNSANTMINENGGSIREKEDSEYGGRVTLKKGGKFVDENKSVCKSTDTRKDYDVLKEVSKKQATPHSAHIILSKNKVNQENDSEINLDRNEDQSPKKREYFPAQKVDTNGIDILYKVKDNPADEQDHILQRSTTICDHSEKQSFGAFKWNKRKSRLVNGKDALKLKISSNMLSQSSHNVKKLRREAVVEAPMMSSHL